MNLPKPHGVILALVLLGAPNVDAQEATDDPANGALPRSESPAGANLSFGNIKNGDILPLTFKVQFRISGMGIAPAGSNIENTGHHHLLIDLATPPEFDAPLPANDNIRHFGKAQSATELTLQPGEHSLQLLFADYVHIPHEPPVISKRITIVVAADAPPQASDEADNKDDS